MPDRPSQFDGTLIPSPMTVDAPLHHIQHGVKPPILRSFVSWSRGNTLQVACIRYFEGEEGIKALRDSDIGGKVVEVKLGARDPSISEAQWRRIVYDSVSPFAHLQGRRNLVLSMSRMSSFSSPPLTDWWQHVLEYSRSISEVLGNSKHSSSFLIGDPRIVLEHAEKPNNLKAAWELMEIFYVDKRSFSWLPERLSDWLAEYNNMLPEAEMTIHSKLVRLQEKLVNLQVVEDDPEYWEGVSAVLSVGWLDFAVKLLRLHGSYQLNQIDNREIENGLVETVAVLISTTPRMRHDLPNEKLGQCYKSKSDFIQAWEKWRSRITKLDCSAFWVQCSHRQTRDGLRNLLQIMLGNFSSLCASCVHWMELLISHFLYIRPLAVGFEEMHELALKCIRIKPSSVSNGLMRLLMGILGENTEARLSLLKYC